MDEVWWSQERHLQGSDVVGIATSSIDVDGEVGLVGTTLAISIESLLRREGSHGGGRSIVMSGLIRGMG